MEGLGKMIIWSRWHCKGISNNCKHGKVKSFIHSFSLAGNILVWRAMCEPYWHFSHLCQLRRVARLQTLPAVIFPFLNWAEMVLCWTELWPLRATVPNEVLWGGKKKNIVLGPFYFQTSLNSPQPNILELTDSRDSGTYIFVINGSRIFTKPVFFSTGSSRTTIK